MTGVDLMTSAKRIIQRMSFKTWIKRNDAGDLALEMMIIGILITVMFFFLYSIAASDRQIQHPLSIALTFVVTIGVRILVFVFIVKLIYRGLTRLIEFLQIKL